MKQKQPVYVVSRLAVLEVIRHQSLFTCIPNNMDWGKVQTAEELTDAINALPREEGDKLNMSRLAQCIQSFYTPKMPANANRMLVRIWAIIKTKREIKNPLTSSPTSGTLPPT